MPCSPVQSRVARLKDRMDSQSRYFNRLLTGILTSGKEESITAVTLFKKIRQKQLYLDTNLKVVHVFNHSHDRMPCIPFVKGMLCAFPLFRCCQGNPSSVSELHENM